MTDLIELQRKYILGLIDEIQTEHNIKFLVIDKEMERIFGFLFRDPNELLAHVTSVDMIDSRHRKGQRDVDVIYMVQESKFNMNIMDTDFAAGGKYKRAIIRFLPNPGSNLVSHFQGLRYVHQYLADVRAVNIGFVPREAQFFQTLHIDKPMQIFYNQHCNDLIDKNLQRTVESLLNLCIITGEYPIIRFSKANESQLETTPAAKLAEKLAFQFQQYLDAYARDHQEFPPPSKRPRAVMIITDRTLDPFSMFLHDFSYQAMAYDVAPGIDLRSDMYHYQAENELGEMEDKETKLTDLVDPDWVELRHQHIVDANEYLGGKIKEMIAKNPLLVDRNKVKNTSDLLSVVAHLKDFDEERRRMILHKTLIEECLTINHDRRLAELADIEQSLASFGVDADGKKTKHFTDVFIEMLLNRKANETDKVRYIILYALYRGGIVESDFMKLLSFAGITQEHAGFNSFLTTFRNFNQLAFQLIKHKPHDKPFNREWFHDSIVKDPNVYNTSRFIPAASNILSKVIANPLLLSEESFPFVKDKPIELLDEDQIEGFGKYANAQSSTSLKHERHKASWGTSLSKATVVENKQRFFYYSIGGITHSEIKAAYEQAALKKADVFIGSDGILTPLSTMTSIEYISKPRDFLHLKDDIREDDSVPDYLQEDLKPIAKPPSHIQYHSKMDQTRPRSAPQVVTQKTPEPEKKEKKKNKFSRFLKRDKK